MNETKKETNDTSTKIRTLWAILKEIVTTQRQVAQHTWALYNTAQTQLTHMKQEWTALTQVYHVADSLTEQQARLGPPIDWQSLLRQVAGGNDARFQQLVASYQTQFPFLTREETKVPAHRLVDATYTQQGQTYHAALATSEYTFDHIATRIQQLEALLHRVDDPQQNPNMKAAIDLNSRISAELGFVQLELLRLYSVQTHLEATHHQGEFSRETLDRQFTHYRPSSGESP